MKASLRVLPLLLALTAGAAQAGVNIKIDDDNFFTIGAQIQPAIALSFDGPCTGVPGACTGNQAPSGNFGFNAYLRRVRILAGGQIGKQVTFSFGTDMPNEGSKGDYAMGSNGTTNQFFNFEAFISYQFIDNQYLDMGFFLVPWSRASIISSAQIHTLETRGAAITLFGADKGSRESGIQYRAYFLERHLNLRLALTKGIPSVAGYYQNQAGRNLVGPPETKGANANVTGFVLDAHAEYPLDKDIEFIVDGAIYKTNQGDGQANTMTAAHAEVGFRYGLIEPTVAWEYKDTDDVQLTNPDGSTVTNKSGFRAVRFGLNYWINKHKFNVKADLSFTRSQKIGQLNPDGPNSPYMQKVATIQSQILF